MADENVGAVDASVCECLVQILDRMSPSPRLQRLITPAVPGAVVRARPRDPGNGRLNESPCIQAHAEAALEHDSRGAGSGTEDVKAITSGIDEPADGRKRRALTCSRKIRE